MKKKHEAEKENSERWLLTYSDMITLLMVFFVVMYAMSTADSAKFSAVAESLAAALGGDITQSQSGAGVGQGKVPTEKSQKVPTIPVQAKTARSLVYDNVYALLKTEVKANHLSINQEERGLVIQLGANFFFKSGSAELPNDNNATLVTLAQALSVVSNEIQIEGFADPTELNAPMETAADKAGTKVGKAAGAKVAELPVAAPVPQYSTSWQLASQRAINLLDFFQSQGVPAERMRAVSFGDTKAVAENTSPEGRAYNRHVDILLLYDSEVNVKP
jgi:Flagellar motor protein